MADYRKTAEAVSALSPEQRAADLVSRMTLEEKAAQLGNDAPAIPRLNVPAYNWWNEGLHGVARAGIATVFPQAIGLAATFDPRLMHEVATAISDEGRAKHHEADRRDEHARYQGLNFWSPNINIFRDPRWGRGQETYGEDPFLTSRMGVAFVTGLQGDDPRYVKVGATAKHYVVHSGVSGDVEFALGETRWDSGERIGTFLAVAQLDESGRMRRYMVARSPVLAFPTDE